MDDIQNLAQDLAKVFGSRGWRFWRRRVTKVEAIHAITHALVGEAKAIQAFGVAMPPGVRTRSERWAAIVAQTKRFRGR